MKYKKRIEILLKIIARVYTKNPGIQKVIDKLVIDIWKEEGVSPQQVFFAFLCCWLYRYGLSKHNFSVCKGQLMKIIEFIFSRDHEKKSYIIF